MPSRSSRRASSARPKTGRMKRGQTMKGQLSPTRALSSLHGGTSTSNERFHRTDRRLTWASGRRPACVDALSEPKRVIAWLRDFVTVTDLVADRLILAVESLCAD